MHTSAFPLCYLPSSHPSTNAITHTYTVEKVKVVLVVIHRGPLSPGNTASWCAEASELEENQEVRSRGIGEGSFLCDSGPLIAKASRLTPGCLFWPIVNWDGGVYSL